MFYYKYDTNPFIYKPSKNAKQKAKQFLHRGLHEFSGKRSQKSKNIAKGLRKIIYGYALLYGFNADYFINKNFALKEHKMYIIFHIPEFSSGLKDNPWGCIKKNSKRIIQHMVNDVKRIKSLLPADLSKSPFNHYITTPDSLSNKDIVTKNSIHNSSNHTDGDGHTFVDNARVKLKPLYHPFDPHYYKFSAICHGCICSPHNNIKGVLLKDVYHDGQKVSKHNWIFGTDKMRLVNKHFKKNEHITFTAQVSLYKKRVTKDSKTEEYDYTLSNFHNIHSIEPQPEEDDNVIIRHNTNNIASTTNDKNDKMKNQNQIHKIVLAQALSKLLDTSQLDYLVRTKRDTNVKSVNKLNQQITKLMQQLHTLKSSRQKLNIEDEQSNDVLKNGAQRLITKQHVNQIKHNQAVLKKKQQKLNPIEIKLVGSIKFLHAITDVWNKIGLAKLKTRYSSVNQAIGTALKLKTYVKRVEKQVGSFSEFDHNLKAHKVTINDTIGIATSYQQSMLEALHDYYHRDKETTIKEIETKHCLTHGSLLKLRHNSTARELEAKAFNESSDTQSTDKKHYGVNDLVKKAQEHNP